MSRARERREQAKLKRQVPEPDDDSEQFEWMDVEAEDDEPDAQGVTE